MNQTRHSTNPQTTAQGLLLDAAPHQALWAMAGVAKSSSKARQEAGAALILAAKKRAPESGRRLIDAFLALHNHLVKLCPWQPAGVRCCGGSAVAALVLLLCWLCMLEGFDMGLNLYVALLLITTPVSAPPAVTQHPSPPPHTQTETGASERAHSQRTP